MTCIDYLILGSGFSGATVALRLAEAGKQVVILERGRRWQGKDLPESLREPAAAHFPEPGDKHFYWGRQILNPQRQRLGLFEIRQFRQLQGLVSAGVGGGSLIWANVVVKAHEESFFKGWPPGTNLESLEQYYLRASTHLQPSAIPGVYPNSEQLSSTYRSSALAQSAEAIPRAALHRAAAAKLGLDWKPCQLAVQFESTAPFEDGALGAAARPACNFCGLCAAGCPRGSKNSVDLTYLPAAMALGAELRTLHEVFAIIPDGSTYLVHFNRFGEDGQLIERSSLRAKNVLLACGTFASTELLLKCKAKGYLRGLSPALGSQFSINGNVLSAALDPHGKGISSGTNNGPAVASMIDFGNYVVEDIANPIWAAGVVGAAPLARIYNFLRSYLGLKSSPERLARLTLDLLVYVGVGLDQAQGQLSLNKFGQLSLNWPSLRSDPAIQAQHRAQKTIAEALGRQYIPDVFSTFGRAFTYHPLGGAAMGSCKKSGVLDAYGAVFDYPGLYVVDGSIVPQALGRNPTYTICALAERAAEHMLRPQSFFGM